MGQSATLYELRKSTFKKLESDPSCFKFDMAEHYEVFERTFDGISFLLTKSVSKEFREDIQQIFFPSVYLGEFIDLESIDFENLKDPSILNNEPISYHSPKKIFQINNILSGIKKDYFLSKYDSFELNQNDIYPGNWHDDNSSDLSSNLRQVSEGFDALIRLFNHAAENENYILAFVG